MSHKFIGIALVPVFLILFLLVSVPVAFAHKVKVFAYGEGEHIVTKSYFSNGKGVQNGHITVLDDGSRKTLIEGKTDTGGMFQFAIPLEAKQGNIDLHIILETGEGHRAEWLLAAEEYIEGPGVQGSEEQVNDSSEKQVRERSLPSSLADIASECNEEDIARIVEEVLDKKLAPVKEMILKSQEQKPRLQDIMGGVGYIIGLAGIVAYMSSRKKKIR
jgi:nickel transport protein